MTTVKGNVPHIAVLADRLLREVKHALSGQDWGGLRSSHFRLLSTVPPSGSTITELSAHLLMTKQAVGQFVKQLRGTGHLDVEADPLDRRRHVAVRTPLGDRTVLAVDEAIAQLEDEWAQRVGAERYAVFRGVLLELVMVEDVAGTS